MEELAGADPSSSIGISNISGGISSLEVLDTLSARTHYKHLIRPVAASRSASDEDQASGASLPLLSFAVQQPQANHALFSKCETLVHARVQRLQIVWMQALFMQIIEFGLGSVLGTLVYDAASAISGAIKESQAARTALDIVVCAPDILVPASASANSGIRLHAGSLTIANCFEQHALRDGVPIPMSLTKRPGRRRKMYLWTEW